MRIRFVLFAVPLLIAVAACTAAPTPTATPAPSPVAAFTATPPPTATPRPTSTSTPAPTATPTATSTPANPLDVAYMRSQTYPGSDLTIEQTLEPGANYDRYIASYLSDGLKIYALLTVPQGEKPETGWPVVIFNHGYIPPNQYRSTERYVAYVDAFARAGYIVLRSDYRGHGNSEGTATGGYATPDYTVDVLYAVSSIKRYPAADPERIGMWGHSMGGGITLRAMVTTKDVKAGVIWAGTVGPLMEMLDKWGHGWIGVLTAQYGTPEENPEFWDAISPNAFVGDLSGPVQLHHGTADESVPLAWSQLLYDQITAAGKPVELYTYEGDNHNLSNNLTLALQRSVAFFDEYVKEGQGG